MTILNHLQYCILMLTIIWPYAHRLKANLDCRHKVKGRTSFAFSNVRPPIAEAALNDDFDPNPALPGKILWGYIAMHGGLINL